MDDRGQVYDPAFVWTLALILTIVALVVSVMMDFHAKLKAAPIEQATSTCNGLWGCGAVPLEQMAVIAGLAVVIIGVLYLTGRRSPNP